MSKSDKGKLKDMPLMIDDFSINMGDFEYLKRQCKLYLFGSDRSLSVAEKEQELKLFEWALKASPLQLDTALKAKVATLKLEANSLKTADQTPENKASRKLIRACLQETNFIRQTITQREEIVQMLAAGFSRRISL